MTYTDLIQPTPWDTAAFGLNTYDIPTVSVAALEQASKTLGHYSVKVDPLASKKLLHDYGFYYCDTLIEPHCTPDRFVFHGHEAVSLARDTPLETLMEICHGAFFFGRFHRDFNLDKTLADLRYDNWLKQLYHAGNVITLLYQGEPAGFFGVSNNKLVLHAVSEKFRGGGLAKYLWSAACQDLFGRGHQELTSSVSAANLPVVNLYASLGFRFRNSLDVYHRLVV